VNPRHHLDASTVLGYAAGALSLELAIVAATHLAACAHCRRQLENAEQVGGILVEQQQPATAEDDHQQALRRAMLEHLSTPVPAGRVQAVRTEEQDPVPTDPDRLPVTLHPYFGASYRALRWRWISPGVQCIRAAGLNTLLLLKIAPSRALPAHGHDGTELTQILLGSYDDALGHFAPGDVADLDSETQHQPVTTAGAPCVCVSALDAPLRFSGWLASRLQPLFKL